MKNFLETHYNKYRLHCISVLIFFALILPSFFFQEVYASVADCENVDAGKQKMYFSVFATGIAFQVAGTGEINLDKKEVQDGIFCIAVPNATSKLTMKALTGLIDDKYTDAKSKLDVVTSVSHITTKCGVDQLMFAFEAGVGSADSYEMSLSNLVTPCDKPKTFQRIYKVEGGGKAYWLSPLETSRVTPYLPPPVAGMCTCDITTNGVTTTKQLIPGVTIESVCKDTADMQELVVLSKCTWVSTSAPPNQPTITQTKTPAVSAGVNTDEYKMPAGYDGPLPACAFDGSCRDINDLLRVAIKIGELALGFVGSLALVFFVYGGFTMILSMGNAEKVKKGRDILVASVIGIVIAFSAYAIVNFTLDVLQVQSDEFRVIK